jgi:protein TonB
VKRLLFTVRVKINRDGTVVDYRLEKPCKHKALNQEALALIGRAKPLPPPPVEVEGKTVEFVVPVEFFLR